MLSKMEKSWCGSDGGLN